MFTRTALLAPLSFLFCISFLTGIFFGGSFGMSGIWLVLFIILLFAIIRWKKWWIFAGSSTLLVAGFVVSMTEIRSLEARTQALGNITAWGNGTYSISGTIGSLIRTNDWSHTYSAMIDSIGEKGIPLTKIALIIPPNLAFEEGDQIEAFGKFSFPKDTPEYASQKQLWYQGIIAEFRLYSSKKVPPTKRSILVNVRNSLDKKLKEYFPDSAYQLLSGVILGQRSSLDATLKNNLKISGLMHIMVVSGSNVMMLIIVLSLVFRSVIPWLRIGIIGISIAGFALLVGGDAPVWRAALMGVIGYGFGLWGWRFPGLILPFLVASILALIRPLALIYDIGFQLSFLSVISIIVFSPIFRKWFAFLGGFFDEAAALTIAATLGTLPITIFYFHTFSPAGIFANLLVAPAIPLVMYSGIVMLGISYFSSAVAYIIGYIPWIFSGYILGIIRFFGQNSPLVTLDVTSYRAEWIIVTLTLFVYLVVRFGKTHLSRCLAPEESSSW